MQEKIFVPLGLTKYLGESTSHKRKSFYIELKIINKSKAFQKILFGKWQGKPQAREEIYNVYIWWMSSIQNIFKRQQQQLMQLKIKYFIS